VVFLAGTSLTAAWVALFFTGADEPAPEQAPADARPVKAVGTRLLILVFDAMREDVALDTKLMPNLAALRARGVWGIARTGSFTMTGTCVRALGTGMTPRPTHVIHNFRSPPIDADSFFRRAHRAGKRTVLIGDHVWVDLYRNTVNRSFPQPDLGIDDLDRTDAVALRDARAQLGPAWDLVVLHLVGSDHSAHLDRHLRGNYRRKLAEYDRLLPELRRRMGEDAAILVMADHACNAVGNHGAGEVEATRAPYVLAGPGILPLGRRDIDQRTVAPTITAYLGVPAPWGAEVPGLVDALDLPAADRAQLLLNHGRQRAAHLQALLGRSPGLRHGLDRAAALLAAGRLAESRAASEATLRQAVTAREQATATQPLLWLAVLLLLLALPLLLALDAGPGDLPPLAAGVGLAAALAAFAAIFLLGARPGALVGAAVVTALALARVGLAPDRRAGLVAGLAGAGLLGAVFCGAGMVELIQRLLRGDGAGRLAALPVGLLLAAGIAVGLRRPLAALWATHRAPAAGLVLGVLAFLPLPALRWWSGRHLLLGGLGGAALAALAVLARRRGWPVRAVLGAGLLAGLVAAGLLGGSLASRSALPWLALVTLVGAPLALAALSGLGRADLARPALGIALAVWLLAHLPRLGIASPHLLLGVLAVALAVLLALPSVRGLALALWVLALFRLLADDAAVALLAGLAVGLAGLAAGLRSPDRRPSPVTVGVALALIELLSFYLLGREFDFGTIDVTVGFVGGGGLDLVRITGLIVLAYAAPWWLVQALAAETYRGDPDGLATVARVQLAVLAVRLAGPLLLFLGRPAHFWLIHSLIPFQFFALAYMLFVATGVAVAWRLVVARVLEEPAP
jgi:hypothetical protein